MMYTTMLPGGVCYHTSTPHNRGNKMKEGKKQKKKMKPNVVFKNSNHLYFIRPTR